MSRIASRFGLVALAALAFGATSSMVRSLLPWPEGKDLAGKIEPYLARAADYDAIFVGSSRFLNGIDPKVIDPIVERESGRPFRSFNLAAAGAGGLEVDHLLRSVLADPDPRLRCVVVEASAFSGTLPAYQRELTERAVSWHTPRQTSRALGDLARSKRETSGRVEDAVAHLKMLGVWLTNLGRGPAAIRAARSRRAAASKKQAAWNLERAGYWSHEDMGASDTAPLRQDLIRNEGEYLKRVAAFDPTMPAPRAGPFPSDVLRAQVAFLQSRGLTPVYVQAPRFVSSRAFLEEAQRGSMPYFFNYADPDAYPELFAVENRWDAGHVGDAGARVWSTHLARDLADVLRTEPDRP